MKIWKYIVVLAIVMLGISPAYAMPDEEQQEVLLKCYAQATYEAFDQGGKACGYITKRTQELAKDQNVTVYAGYIKLADGREHLAPLVLLDNGIYYGYEYQGNVWLASAMNGRYQAYIMGDWVYREVTKRGYPPGTVYIPDEYIEKHPLGTVYLRSAYIDDLPNIDVSFWGNIYEKIRSVHIRYR